MGLVLLAAVTAMLISGCANQGPQPPGPNGHVACTIEARMDIARRALAMRDCLRRDSVPVWMGSEARRLMAAGWSIPEAHDEQRLMIDDFRYGPMTFVFASPYASQFEQEWQVAEHGDQGMLAALVYVDTSYFEPDGTPLELGGQYASLHLGPGLNCVWLSYDPQAPNPWNASITHPVKPGSECSASQTGVDLDVARSTGLRPTDYPAVARFTEEHVTGSPLLGFRCLDGWCDVGTKDAAAPSLRVRESAAVSLGGREGRVSGWHDEQRLSAWVDGALVRTEVRATLVPVPGLQQRSAARYEGEWLQVATIIVSGTGLQDTKYAAWGLRLGANKLWLRDRAGDWQMKVAASASDAGVPWSGSVERGIHRDAPVPGTARFRFNSYDEGIWIPCGNACCYSKGGAQ